MEIQCDYAVMLFQESHAVELRLVGYRRGHSEHADYQSAFMAVVGQFNGDLSCAQGMRRLMDGSVGE